MCGRRWQQAVSYTPVGKLGWKRLVFRTEGATYADVREAIASHREPEGNGKVTLVLERAVNASTASAPRDAVDVIEPLSAVILRDLRTPAVEDGMTSADGKGARQLSPQERARRLFELGVGPDPDEE